MFNKLTNLSAVGGGGAAKYEGRRWKACGEGGKKEF